MSRNTGDYIDPSTATYVRIHPDGMGNWQIDAANDYGYTEASWASWFPTAEDDFIRESDLISSVVAAQWLVPLFIEENVPHLVGTEPVVEDGEPPEVN